MTHELTCERASWIRHRDNIDFNCKLWITNRKKKSGLTVRWSSWVSFSRHRQKLRRTENGRRRLRGRIHPRGWQSLALFFLNSDLRRYPGHTHSCQRPRSRQGSSSLQRQSQGSCPVWTTWMVKIAPFQRYWQVFMYELQNSAEQDAFQGTYIVHIVHYSIAS
jgi:hypothetical protein